MTFWGTVQNFTPSPRVTVLIVFTNALEIIVLLLYLDVRAVSHVFA